MDSYEMLQHPLERSLGLVYSNVAKHDERKVKETLLTSSTGIPATKLELKLMHVILAENPKRLFLKHCKHLA